MLADRSLGGLCVHGCEHVCLHVCTWWPHMQGLCSGLLSGPGRPVELSLSGQPVRVLCHLEEGPYGKPLSGTVPWAGLPASYAEAPLYFVRSGAKQCTFPASPMAPAHTPCVDI